MKRFIKFLLMLLVLAMAPGLAFSEEGWRTWDAGVEKLVYQKASGGGATYTTITGVTGTAGGTSVSIASANHMFYTGAEITINGTTYFDDTYAITARDSTSFTITFAATATALAETFSGATVSVSLKPDVDFQLLGFTLCLDSAASTAEQLSITVDSNSTSYSTAEWDVDIYSKSMTGVKEIVKSFGMDEMYRYKGGDEIDVIWVNTDSREWTITLVWRRRI